MENASKKSFNWGLLITALITVFGWYFANSVNNYYSAKRDRENKLRDIKLNYLIDAYRKLANASIRNPKVLSYKLDMESTVSDIQLFGSIEEIDTLNTSLDKKGNSKDFELDPLLKIVRDNLRKELNLDAVDGDVRWLRLNNEDTDPLYDSNHVLKYPQILNKY